MKTLILKLTTMIPALALLFFLPAGTIFWPQAWLFLGIFFLYAIIGYTYMYKKDPALLKERTTWKDEETKIWDLWITNSFFPLFIIGITVIAFDARRFMWSQVPLALQILAFILISIGLMIILSTMTFKTFLARTVKIQKKRGHTVVTQGPYSIVRHPFYFGFSLFLIGFPSALGSYWGYLPIGVIQMLLLIRTYLEDITLQNELDGYKEYTTKTKYRLIPYVW